MTKRDHYQQS